MNLNPLQLWEFLKTLRNLSRAQWGQLAGVVAGVTLPLLFACKQMDAACLIAAGTAGLIAAVGWCHAQSQVPTVGVNAPTRAAGIPDETLPTRASL